MHPNCQQKTAESYPSCAVRLCSQLWTEIKYKDSPKTEQRKGFRTYHFEGEGKFELPLTQN